MQSINNPDLMKTWGQVETFLLRNGARRLGVWDGTVSEADLSPFSDTENLPAVINFPHWGFPDQSPPGLPEPGRRAVQLLWYQLPETPTGETFTISIIRALPFIGPEKREIVNRIRAWRSALRAGLATAPHAVG